MKDSLNMPAGFALLLRPPTFKAILLMKKRKLRMGMVGGGPGAFIGAVHRMAAAMDGQIELVCGAFSSDPEKSAAMGRELMLPTNRAYGSWEEMIQQEKTLGEDERMDFVSIVSPNHLHAGPALMALQEGFDVICDKPLCHSMEEAMQLQTAMQDTDRIFCLSHNYTGYPMVRQARFLARNGHLGKIRKVVVEYPQGWLSERIENTGQKQAAWRTNPAMAGAAGCMGDIGTHAENLAEFITGLEIMELAADLSRFAEGRQLDDDGSVLLRFNDGAKGILHASQVSAGEENNLRIRVYGEKAGLDWSQQEPNTLILRHGNRPAEILRSGQAGLCPEAASACRLPPGHPEGYLEAFANLYREFAEACYNRNLGIKNETLLPGIKEGVRGMRFISAVVNSSAGNARWEKV